MLAHHQRCAGYRRYVELTTDEELSQFYGRARWAPILGDETFVEQASAREWRNVSAEGLRRQLYEPSDFDRIVWTVSRTFALEQAIVLAGKRGHRNEARWAAMYLCQQVGGMSLAMIAERFGLGHISGVSHHLRRLKDEVQENPQLRDKLNLLNQQLTP